MTYSPENTVLQCIGCEGLGSNQQPSKRAPLKLKQFHCCFLVLSHHYSDVTMLLITSGTTT